MKKRAKSSVSKLESTCLDCPDAVAKITMSLSDGRILDVTMKEEKDSKHRQASSNRSTRSYGGKTSFSQDTMKIWDLVNSADIDIDYACIGYSLDGRAVLDYRNFIDLIVTSGFSADDAVAFIDEFAKTAEKVDNAPIVMTDKNTTKILTDVHDVAHGREA